VSLFETKQDLPLQQVGREGRLSTSTIRERLDSEKEVVARAAVRFVKSGMRVGLGSGSTSHQFIRLLGERVHRGELSVEAVATSKQSEALAEEVGIAMTEVRRGLRLDLAVDGADEIGPDLTLIKGGGGAHLREKVVAAAADYFLVIADSSKLVKQLGTFPVPLEVVPFAMPWVMDRIALLGSNAVLRMDPESRERPYLTDQQNYIMDCHFQAIEQPAQLASQLEKIPGIVEHGLFIGYARAALIAQGESVCVLRRDVRLERLSNFDELP
jgi:ribose 5-phosphate isomerase A